MALEGAMSRRSWKSLVLWVVPAAVFACSGGPGGMARPGTLNGDPSPNGQQPAPNGFQPIRAGTTGVVGSTNNGGCTAPPGSGCTCVCQGATCITECTGAGGTGGDFGQGGSFGQGGTGGGFGQGGSNGSCSAPDCTGCHNDCEACLCATNDDMTTCGGLCGG
jgi:hypothetical protein